MKSHLVVTIKTPRTKTTTTTSQLRHV